MIPTRHIVTPAARAQFGERLDRLAAFLTQGDPLADAAVDALAPLPAPERKALLDRALAHGRDAVPQAPAALHALCDQVFHVPFWFDLERANRGGAAFLRSGMLGGFVLGLRSLVGGYISPAGNKPLVFSGRLAEDTPRRLIETARFVQLASARDEMRVGAEGFRAAVEVRLIHAKVRRVLLASPKWKLDEWGVPINQMDMAATLLLFGYVMIVGLRRLGFQLTREEADDILHLWRYAGHLMGVAPELCCATEREAEDLMAMISATQAPADDDSRRLAAALIEHPLTVARSDAERAAAKRFVRFTYAMSRYLIGDEYADQLGFPRTTTWRYALPAMSAVLARTDAAWRRLPFGDRLALEAGMRYWRSIVTNPLVGGAPITFAMPEHVRYAGTAAPSSSRRAAS